MSATLDSRWKQLIEAWPAGSKLTDAIVLEVLREGDQAILVFRWAKDPRRFGLRFSLNPPFREFGYGTTLHSWNEWIDSLVPSLLAHLDTGLVENSARVKRDTYVELLPTQSWWYSDGYDYETSEKVGRDGEIGITVTAVPLASDESPVSSEVLEFAPARGRLTIAVPTRSYDAHAVLDTAHLACHIAASNGLTLLTTTPRPHLDVLGFRATGSNGDLELDTSFELEDVDRVRRIFG